MAFFKDSFSPEDQPVPLLAQTIDGDFGYRAIDVAAIRHRIQERKATLLLSVVEAR